MKATLRQFGHIEHKDNTGWIKHYTMME